MYLIWTCKVEVMLFFCVNNRCFCFIWYFYSQIQIPLALSGFLPFSPEKPQRQRWRCRNLQSTKRRNLLCLCIRHFSFSVDVKDIRFHIVYFTETAISEWYNYKEVSVESLGAPCTSKNKCRSVLPRAEKSMFNSFRVLQDFDVLNQ
jgi:hypothetical protein